MAKLKKLTRSEIMSRVHSKNTQPELILRKALWKKGFHYRKNVSYVYGKPDIAFIRCKIAIFCDSEFWHGKYYIENKCIPTSNRDYWIEKFKKNIIRDKKVNEMLLQSGWIVLRYWEKDIRSDPNKIVTEIIDVFNERKLNKLKSSQ